MFFPSGRDAELIRKISRVVSLGCQAISTYKHRQAIVLSGRPYCEPHLPSE